MNIIIGRDADTARLLLTDGTQNLLFGQPGSVPKSVGLQHCELIITDELIRLKNLDVNNFTFVNEQSIESKAVSMGDRIELGANRYLLDWNAVSGMVADTQHLRDVWNEYEQKSLDLTIDERRFNTLRSITGVITMVAIALSFATGGRSKLYIALYALAIIASLILFIKAYRDASKIPQRRQNLNRQFQRDYICPHCHRFLGNQSYDILAQNDHCPYCKTKFIH